MSSCKCHFENIYKCHQGFTWEPTLLLLMRNGPTAPIDRKSVNFFVNDYETNERERIVHETSPACMWNDNFFALISRFIWNSTAFTRKQWNVVFNVSLNYECPLSIDIQILELLKERTKTTISPQNFVYIESLKIEFHGQSEELRPKTTIIPQLSGEHTLYLLKFQVEFYPHDNRISFWKA